MKELLKTEITQALRRELGDQIEIIEMTPIGGGDINHALKLRTTDGDFFMKYNDTSQFPMMLNLEAQGLKTISTKGGFLTPEVIAKGEAGTEQFLILAWVESTNHHDWELFGSQLARMHQSTQESFGFEIDNYIGSIQQFNDAFDRWVEFYIVMRLDYMLELAFNKGALPKEMTLSFQRLYAKLDDYIPKESPALLHGDLWSGNFINSEKGIYLIDPAVYYGHREMDLAMMHLFGGFDATLFESYHRSFALENGWKERLDLHQLYPLLVHVNLFGGGYVDQVGRILKKYT